MPDYVNNALVRLRHYYPIKHQHYPHPYNAPIYIQKRQFVIPTTTSKELTPAQLKHCQEFCGFQLLFSSHWQHHDEPIMIAKFTECFCFQERVRLIYYWALIL